MITYSTRPCENGQIELPCGCRVPPLKATLLKWLFEHKWLKLWDIVHGRFPVTDDEGEPDGNSDETLKTKG